MSVDEERVLLLCGLLVAREQPLAKAEKLSAGQWVELLTLANRLWLGSTLAHQLQATSLWQKLDPELQTYLDSLSDFSHERNRQMAQLAESIQAIFEKSNIDTVWIKGGSTLFNGIDNPVGRRWMMDLDLLVGEGQVDDALHLLMEAGFKTKEPLEGVVWRHHHHVPGLISPDGKHTVELHFLPLDSSLPGYLSTSEAFANRQSLMIGNQQGWQLGYEDQVVHALVHDQLSNGHYNNNVIHLRYLLHFCWLAEQFSAVLDWGSILRRIDNPKLVEITLYICWKLFGLETPVTEKSSSLGHHYWTVSLHNHLDPRFSFQAKSAGQRLIRSFSRRDICFRYGCNNGLTVFIGRLRNAMRLITARLHPLFWQKEKKKLKLKRTATTWHIN